jgi:hypothetical protein
LLEDYSIYAKNSSYSFTNSGYAVTNSGYAVTNSGDSFFTKAEERRSMVRAKGRSFRCPIADELGLCLWTARNRL